MASKKINLEKNRVSVKHWTGFHNTNLKKLDKQITRSIPKKVLNFPYYIKQIEKFNELRDNANTIDIENLFVYLEFVHNNKLSELQIKKIIDYLYVGLLKYKYVPLLDGYIHCNLTKYSLINATFKRTKVPHKSIWRSTKYDKTLKQLNIVILEKLGYGANISIGEHIIISRTDTNHISINCSKKFMLFSR